MKHLRIESIMCVVGHGSKVATLQSVNSIKKLYKNHTDTTAVPFCYVTDSLTSDTCHGAGGKVTIIILPSQAKERSTVYKTYSGLVAERLMRKADIDQANGESVAP